GGDFDRRGDQAGQYGARGSQLPHREARGGGGADGGLRGRGGGGLRGDRRAGGDRGQGADRIAGGAGVGVRRADVEDRAQRADGVGDAGASAEAAPGATGQPGARTGDAPGTGG